jgi:hypothetical protein
MSNQSFLPLNTNIRRFVIKGVILIALLVLGYYITFVVFRRTTSDVVIIEDSVRIEE